MNPTHDLRPIIASLRAEGGANLVRRRVDPSSSVAVYVGLDAAQIQLGVMLAVPRHLAPIQRDLPSGAGFATKVHAVKDDASGIVTLGVFCTDHLCEDIFFHFMDDLVSHLLAETAPERAIKTFLARLGLWQRFFIAGRTVLLSEEAQCGLFGELLMLRDLLIPTVGPPAAVDAWKGPEGSPQDFRLPSCALEVKCSRAKVGSKIPIASEQQLDERPFPRLVLAHVAVTVGGGTNQSLIDIVADLRSLLSATGRPLGRFNDQLIAAGWIEAHVEHYSENRFFVRETHYFEVKDDFPRIRIGDCKQGVMDITYKLDPASLTQFEVERGAVEGWLKV